MLMMRPQRVRTIGITSGWVTWEKTVERHVDHPVPLRRLHAGKNRVVMDAGIVHDDLDRAALEQQFQCRSRTRPIGDIEDAGLRPPPRRNDFAGQLLGRHGLPVGMHDHVEAIGREPAADGRADAAAASRDQRSPHAWGHELSPAATRCAIAASSTTVARPRSSRRSSAATSKL